MMSHPKTVAWGEMGLDYFYDFSDRETQKKVFGRQLQKAVELNKPIVIHARDADEGLEAFPLPPCKPNASFFRYACAYATTRT